MEHNRDEVKKLLARLRATAGAGTLSPGATDLLDRLEVAIDRVLADAEALQTRLERPPPGPTVTHAAPARLEAWVRKLEQPGTANQ